MHYTFLKYAEKISANTKAPLQDTEWAFVEQLYADGVTFEEAVREIERKRSDHSLKQKNKFVWDN